MQAVKQEALNAIFWLLEDADVEDIVYRLYALENILRGQENAAKVQA